MIEINGLRVKQAREIKRMTQTELANRLNVNQYTVARMESDVREWATPTVEALAFQLGFPISFFQQGIPPESPSGSFLFRCRVDLAANEVKYLRQIASLETEIIEKLSYGVKPLELRLPVLTNISPIEAAQITRAALSLSPDTPIPHLINRLERNGILVFSIPRADKKFDAFSLWSDGEPRKPMIVINDDKPTDRVRYSSAHEVGHLVLHTSPRGKPADLDKEADIFAAEFLLPAEAMRREIPSPLTLTDLAKLKPRWGVSIQALIVRAYKLDIITERQYRYMFEQISKLGWRTREPENLDIPKEKPRLLRKLAELAFGVPVSADKVAPLISASPSFIADLLSVYAEHKEMPVREEKRLAEEVEEEIKSNNILKFKR